MPEYIGEFQDKLFNGKQLDLLHFYMYQYPISCPILSNFNDFWNSEFIGNWISIGKPARMRTKSLTADQPFDQQCGHCAKV